VEGTGSVIRPTAVFGTGGDENSGSTISVSQLIGKSDCLFREIMTSTSSTPNIFLYVLHPVVSFKTVYCFPNIFVGVARSVLSLLYFCLIRDTDVNGVLSWALII
jgi:hypothetical protein